MAFLPDNHEILRGVNKKDHHTLELRFKSVDTLELYTISDQQSLPATYKPVKAFQVLTGCS